MSQVLFFFYQALVRFDRTHGILRHFDRTHGILRHFDRTHGILRHFEREEQISSFTKEKNQLESDESGLPRAKLLTSYTYFDSTAIQKV